MKKEFGVYIDIEQMRLSMKELQKHVEKNKKDEQPKIKLRKMSAKIKALEKYGQKKYKKILNK